MLRLKPELIVFAMAKDADDSEESEETQEVLLFVGLACPEPVKRFDFFGFLGIRTEFCAILFTLPLSHIMGMTGFRQRDNASTASRSGIALVPVTH